MLSISADRILLPLANEDDAVSTCASLTDAVDPGGTVVLLHVIEKAGGAPDKASVEQRQGVAEETFAAARERLADDWTVETEIRYDTDVGEGIVAAAEALAADAVVFSPRDTGLLTRLLTGTTAMDIVADAPVPVVVLPSRDE